MLEVDKYLDDSYIAGLTHVTAFMVWGTGFERGAQTDV